MFYFFYLVLKAALCFAVDLCDLISDSATNYSTFVKFVSLMILFRLLSFDRTGYFCVILIYLSIQQNESTIISQNVNIYIYFLGPEMSVIFIYYIVQY